MRNRSSGSDLAPPGAATAPATGRDDTDPPTAATGAEPAAASSPGETARGPDAQGQEPERRARRREVERHLAAAEDARRQGNRLKQMAEADSALALAPGNRQAAFLMGDALLASGDEQNACKYLRRARALRQARDALQRAGCAGD